VVHNALRWAVSVPTLSIVITSDSARSRQSIASLPIASSATRRAATQSSLFPKSNPVDSKSPCRSRHVGMRSNRIAAQTSAREKQYLSIFPCRARMSNRGSPGGHRLSLTNESQPNEPHIPSSIIRSGKTCAAPLRDSRPLGSRGPSFLGLPGRAILAILTLPAPIVAEDFHGGGLLWVGRNILGGYGRPPRTIGLELIVLSSAAAKAIEHDHKHTP
jgi:hypothetical protein